MKIEITGLDELKRQLDKLQRIGEQPDGSHQTSFAELFTDRFMRANSTVASFEALIKAGGFTAETAEEFLAISNSDWEKCVRAHTRFTSWLEMQETAGAEWLQRKVEGVL
jgi:hypothetical protein